MVILNLEELKKQIKEGTFKGLDSLENEFKSMCNCRYFICVH